MKRVKEKVEKTEEKLGEELQILEENIKEMSRLLGQVRFIMSQRQEKDS